MASRFELSWRLTVTSDQAQTLSEALAPETEGTYAELTLDPETLTATGSGDAGRCLHTLDDLLACLTGAVEALEADPEDA